MLLEMEGGIRGLEWDGRLQKKKCVICWRWGKDLRQGRPQQVVCYRTGGVEFRLRIGLAGEEGDMKNHS